MTHTKNKAKGSPALSFLKRELTDMLYQLVTVNSWRVARSAFLPGDPTGFSIFKACREMHMRLLLMPADRNSNRPEPVPSILTFAEKPFVGNVARTNTKSTLHIPQVSVDGIVGGRAEHLLGGHLSNLGMSSESENAARIQKLECLPIVFLV